MMTFAAFKVKLAQGQLKNTAAVAEDALGVIDSAYESQILNLTNQGLVDLSTRFPIIIKYIDLIFIEDQNSYLLDPAGVGTYLDESLTEEFTDDFIKVLGVYDADGKDYPIDTNGHIMTPLYNSLRFTSAIIETLGTRVRVRYQAKHPVIEASDSISLPPNLETALQLFVSSLYISHMNGAEHTEKGDKYFAAYLRHIGEDELRNNSSTSEVQEDTRFSDRGFV